MGWSIEIESRGVDETLAIGRAVGSRLDVADVVGLVGPLGAGKTLLTKGIASGLLVSDLRLVNSPTFVLVNEYEGRTHVFHIDAYRLEGERQLEALGFEEMCSGRGVVVVEWAERVAAALGPDALWVEVSVTGASERRLVLRTASTGLRRRLEQAGLDRWRSGGKMGNGE